MTIIITKTKLAVGVLAVVLIATTAAFAAAHPFNDVPAASDPGARFYSTPVQWAWDNSLTTGSPSGSDTFKPLDAVTRGENITFNYRYDTNVVQPALTTLTGGVATNTATAAANSAAIASNDTDIATLTGTAAANSAAIVGNDVDIAAMPTVHWARVSISGSVEASSGSVTAVEAGTGFFDVTFPDPVGNCAIHATLSHRSNTAGNIIIGLAYAAEAYVVVSDNTSSDDGVIRVHTYIHSSTSAGTLAVATSLPFAVMATC